MGWRARPDGRHGPTHAPDTTYAKARLPAGTGIVDIEVAPVEVIHQEIHQTHEFTWADSVEGNQGTKPTKLVSNVAAVPKRQLLPRVV